MRRRTREQQRKVLHGWMKWVPVLALVFGVLFADTWLNTQIRANDYEYSRLKRCMAQLGKDLDTLRVEEAGCATLARLETAAPDLGLVKPEPMQIEVICLGDSEQKTVPAGTMLLAQSHPAAEPVFMVGPELARAGEVPPRLLLRPTAEEKAAPRRPTRGKAPGPVAQAARRARPSEAEIDLDDSLDALLATL